MSALKTGATPWFLILVIFIITNNVYGQTYNFYGAKSHLGLIIPHSEDLRSISNTTPWGIQLEWSRLKATEKAWNNCNCYAQSGLSFNYYNYGNPDQLGNSYNLIYFTEPYLNFGNRLYYSFRAGIGVTYLNKVYDAESNPENTFYSSPISFLLQASLNVNYKLNQHYILSASANYNHISNGGMQQPNKGMNFPTASLGLSYTPELLTLEKREKSLINKNKLLYYIRLFGTLPEVEGNEIDENTRKLLLGLTGGALYHITQTNAINAGVELISNGAHKEAAERMNEDYDHHVVNLLLGHNFIFGRITFNQQLGFYIYRPFPATSKDIFQRYELLYQLGDRFQVGTSLKAHGHVADNFDLRLGILLY